MLKKAMELLLDIALQGTAHHVETAVRQFRRVQEAAEMSREARQHANRRLTCSYDHDGSPVINARLPAEIGAVVISALDAAMGDLPSPAMIKDVSAETAAEDRPSTSARRAVHDGGITIQRLDDGAWRFAKRNGESLRACVPGRAAPLCDWSALVAAHPASGIGIDKQPAASLWRDERMDSGLAIDLLLSKLQGAARAQVGGALL